MLGKLVGDVCVEDRQGEFDLSEELTISERIGELQTGRNVFKVVAGLIEDLLQVKHIDLIFDESLPDRPVDRERLLEFFAALDEQTDLINLSRLEEG